MKTIDLVGWLRNWFYTKEESYNKTEVDSLLEEKSGNNGFGSFYINDEGHLIVVIPSNVNPYKIIDGHLIYDTEAT